MILITGLSLRLGMEWLACAKDDLGSLREGWEGGVSDTLRRRSSQRISDFDVYNLKNKMILNIL